MNPKTTKDLIKTVKTSQLLLSKHCDIDDFLVSRYIAKMVVLLSPISNMTSSAGYLWQSMDTVTLYSYN